MHVHPGAGDGGVVFTVAAPVHVKAVAERVAQFNVVTGFITAARSARSGDGVTVVVEEVVGDARG